jgi:hypothetical protein
MFQTDLVEKLETKILRSINFFTNVFLWDNVGKYGTARQDTDDNIGWRMRFTCLINEAKDYVA